jgi:hypothetical protein
LSEETRDSLFDPKAGACFGVCLVQKPPSIP